MTLITTEAPKAYFMEHIEKTVSRHNYGISEDTQAYLAFMLEKFILSGNFIVSRPKDQTEESLSKSHPDENDIFVYLRVRAIETEDLLERFSLFVEIGDTALFHSGYLGNRSKDKINNAYCIGMGKGGYDSAAELAARISILHSGAFLYRELTENFEDLTSIVNETLEVEELPTEKHKLEALERVLRFQQDNAQLLETLAKYGIFPRNMV